MQSVLQTTFLTNTSLLRCYAKGKTPNVDLCRDLSFLRARGDAPHYPDYVFKNRWNAIFAPKSSLSELLIQSLEDLANRHLEVKVDSVYVKKEAFDSWQETLTKFPPLPIIAFALFLHDKNHKNQRSTKSAPNTTCDFQNVLSSFAKTALPSIDHPGLTKLIDDYGLRDLHLHLNGSTESDWMWQDALKRPNSFGRFIVQAVQQNVRQQYLQIDENLSPETLRPLLNIASNLRILLSNKLTLGLHPLPTPNILTLNGNWSYPLSERRKHPYSQFQNYHGPNSDLCQEICFLVQTYSVIAENRRPLFAQYLHYYLLIQSFFNKMLVQQATQKGFDQFEKITQNNFRDYSEGSYFHRRFEQMEGPYGQDLEFLEGRFAPKSNGEKFYNLLNRINKEYTDYLECKDRHSQKKDKSILPKRLRLGLVAHFIKKPQGKYCNCQHHDLRKSLEKQARILIELRRHIPRYRRLITGCDAAGNELFTPPEVFGPIFRRLRDQRLNNQRQPKFTVDKSNKDWKLDISINHFTFHAGEDFVHLLSGIRATWEAVEFLELKHKDRIGHATALGISPKLWRKRIGDSVYVRLTHWLDDLIFAWHWLQGEGEWTAEVYKLLNEIHHVSRKIYGKPIAPAVLYQAWKLRKFDPIKAFVNPERARSSLSPFDKAEWTEIQTMKTNHPEAFELFKHYHGRTISEMTLSPERGKSAFIEVPTNFLSINTTRDLQHKVLRAINFKNIALEAMPTSNVRISFYQRYSEHHFYHWKRIVSEDSVCPEPIICICSDDPGIFTTNTRNEYAHILVNLTQEYGIEDHVACSILERMIKDSRKFTFVPSTSSDI